MKFAVQNRGSGKFLAAAFLGELSEAIVLSALSEVWVQELSTLLLK